VLSAFACIGLGFGTGQAVADEPPAQWVQFTQYSTMAGNAEIAGRMMSPLQSARLRARLAEHHQSLPDQPVDLAQERFLLLVPPERPPEGYGLLVFVSPWAGAHVPLGWASELSRRGFIFVAADRAGNDQDVLGRRVPLALLAQENVRQRYPVNARRTYVAGFSGGSRVAMRLALAYPDVFAGAVLNAGSDPVGNADVPIPPRELFLAFQVASKLVYATGRYDEYPRRIDAESRDSLDEWCVFAIRAQEIPTAGHEVADARALARALDTLSEVKDPVPTKLASCRDTLDAKVDAEIKRIDALHSEGRREDARRAVLEFDARWGGYAGARGAALIERFLSDSARKDSAPNER
jgi:predicted esterase